MRVNQPETERRMSPRVGLETEFKVRKFGGFAFQLRVLNASAGGCRVELIDPVDTAERIIVRLPALEPLSANVAWVDGNNAGLRFERPLYPAVFDHFIERYAPCAA